MRQYFGGVDPTFTQVNLGTSTNTDPTGEWELEESLDVEWAHAMAPQASIILVEAVTNSTTNLLAAVDKAVSFGPQVVSMSWSGNEFSTEATDDSHFAARNVAFVASAGDSGAPAEFPNTSPNVLSVGGTSLALNSNNQWSGEVGWFDSGGGPSTYESRPAYQPTTYNNGTSTGIPLNTRGTPDVAYDAARESAASVYDSYPHSKPNVYITELRAAGLRWAAQVSAPAVGSADRSGRPGTSPGGPGFARISVCIVDAICQSERFSRRCQRHEYWKSQLYRGPRL